MLKVFSNDYDWYVAESPEHATQLWSEWTGDDFSDYDYEWNECDPDESLRIGFEDFFDMKTFPLPQIAQWE